MFLKSPQSALWLKIMMTTKRSMTMGLTGTEVTYNAQIYILFKISASGLFLKYSSNFTNFSLDVLIKYILIKKSVRYYLVNAQFIYEIKKCNHGEFGLKKEEKKNKKKQAFTLGYIGA